MPRACQRGEIEALARKAGFRLRWSEAGRRAVLSRNRWSPLGTVLFHGALLLLPVAWLLSGATRFEGRAWIVEGHPFTGTRQEYYAVSPNDDFDARAPRLAFQVEEVRARFWGERLFFTDLRALVATAGSDEADSRWMRLPEPAWIDGARVSIRGFNYTPAVELVGPDGRLAESADLSLRLFPPGTEDSFTLPPLPHRFWVRLYPDSDGPSAVPLNRGFDLRRPLFHVAVTCGKRLVTHGWLRPGEALAFDGRRIAFPRVRRGGEILVHRDRGYALAWFALAAGLAGLVARAFFPASRVWIVAQGGRTLAAGRDDVFGRGRGAALVGELSRHAD